MKINTALSIDFTFRICDVESYLFAVAKWKYRKSVLYVCIDSINKNNASTYKLIYSYLLNRL